MIQVNNGHLYCSINDGSKEGIRTITDDVYHFVVATYDGTYIRLYVDGILDAIENIGSKVIDTTAILRIGTDRTQTDFFDGVIDEVRIYNRALSPEEIRTLFNITVKG